MKKPTGSPWLSSRCNYTKSLISKRETSPSLLVVSGVVWVPGEIPSLSPTTSWKIVWDISTRVDLLFSHPRSHRIIVTTDFVIRSFPVYIVRLQITQTRRFGSRTLHFTFSTKRPLFFYGITGYIYFYRTPLLFVFLLVTGTLSWVRELVDTT